MSEWYVESRHDGREMKSPTRETAMTVACQLKRDSHMVRRVVGPHGEIVELPEIERHYLEAACRGPAALTDARLLPRSMTASRIPRCARGCCALCRATVRRNAELVDRHRGGEQPAGADDRSAGLKMGCGSGKTTALSQKPAARRACEPVMHQ